MTQSIRERNRTLVLQAFDFLFNKRDFAAAEKYWSPHYIQHSAHIAPGSYLLRKSLPWAHRTRFQQLRPLFLTTNVSDKLGNLLFAQS
jgi:predicted SnoaL-like aldol condensation-catalyzing enzyme